ncbi:MAG: TetR/AcrR family transcriptional regulator [Asticcacaulis sp.]
MSTRPKPDPKTANQPSDCGCAFNLIGEHFGIRQRNKALRPGQILDAALDEFCTKGYDATRVEDIARRARISKALVYVYYPTKIDLFLAVAERLIEPYRQAETDFKIDETRPAEAQMREHHDLFYRTIACDPQALSIFRLMVAESARAPEIATFYRRHFLGAKTDAIKVLISHGVKRGEFSRACEDQLEGMEDILGGPAVMLMLVQVLTGEAGVYNQQRWQQTHWDMIMAYLKRP